MIRYSVIALMSLAIVWLGVDCYAQHQIVRPTTNEFRWLRRLKEWRESKQGFIVIVSHKPEMTSILSVAGPFSVSKDDPIVRLPVDWLDIEVKDLEQTRKICDAINKAVDDITLKKW